MIECVCSVLLASCCSRDLLEPVKPAGPAAPPPPRRLTFYTVTTNCSLLAFSSFLLRFSAPKGSIWPWLRKRGDCGFESFHIVCLLICCTPLQTVNVAELPIVLSTASKHSPLCIFHRFVALSKCLVTVFLEYENRSLPPCNEARADRERM